MSRPSQKILGQTPRRIQQRGFTLAEVMVVIGLIGILTAMGMGNFNTVFQNQDFDTAVNETASVFAQARFYAIRTGQFVGVTLEGGAVVAFLDANGDYAFSQGENVVARYPSATGSTLPANITVDCITLRERGSGPRTAFFDTRGFYVDRHDNTSRHGANLCISDSITGRKKTITLSPFGNVSIGADQCEAAPFVCPNVAPQ